MKFRKIITVFLLLVMVLQLLPVKQAVRYFFMDNIIIEELVHLNKNATKSFRLLDEDHYLPDTDLAMHYFLLVSGIYSYHAAEQLPAFQVSDIHTPPPNRLTVVFGALS